PGRGRLLDSDRLAERALPVDLHVRGLPAPGVEPLADVLQRARRLAAEKRLRSRRLDDQRHLGRQTPHHLRRPARVSQSVARHIEPDRSLAHAAPDPSSVIKCARLLTGAVQFVRRTPVRMAAPPSSRFSVSGSLKLENATPNTGTRNTNMDTWEA